MVNTHHIFEFSRYAAERYRVHPKWPFHNMAVCTGFENLIEVFSNFICPDLIPFQEKPEFFVIAVSAYMLMNTAHKFLFNPEEELGRVSA